jgi:hypothetical protein
VRCFYLIIFILCTSVSLTTLLGKKTGLLPEWKLNCVICVHYFIRVIFSTHQFGSYDPLTKPMYYRLLLMLLLSCYWLYAFWSEAIGGIRKFVREHETQQGVKDKEVGERYREEKSNDPPAPFRRRRTRESCARTFLFFENLCHQSESVVSVNQVIGPTVDSTRPSGFWFFYYCQSK